MRLRKGAPLTVAAIALTCNCYAAAPALFAAKELQLHGAKPREADLDRPFEAPLPAQVQDSAGKRLVQLANCRDFLAVRSRIVGSDTDADYRVLRLQTVPCLIFALLKSAGTAQRTALPSDFARDTATTSYPATLWPAISNDEQERLGHSGATLRTATKKATLRRVNGNTLELKADNVVLHLTLLARGDFDHDGWEDAAFRWEGYAQRGSYSDARVAVLTRTGTGSLRELPVDKLLATP